MNQTLVLLLCSLAVLSAQTFPFSRVYIQTHEPHATQAKTFLWGLSGNVTFFLDQVLPKKSMVTLSVFETDSQRLSADDEKYLNTYFDIVRVDNFVAMTFKATQIALSVYPPTHCGMFLDLEDTVDMDIPVDAKTGVSDVKIMFNLIFPLDNQDDLVKDYNFLEGVCVEKSKVYGGKSASA